VSTAHKRVTDACAAVVSPSVEEIRSTEGARIERLQAKLAPAVNKGEIPAVAESRRLSESLRRLHGADAPVKSELEIRAQLDMSAELTAGVITSTVAAVVRALEADRSMPAHMIERYAIEYAGHALARLAGEDVGDPPEPPHRVVSGRVLLPGTDGHRAADDALSAELEAVKAEFPEFDWGSHG
jgi:hypothetical protein